MKIHFKIGDLVIHKKDDYFKFIVLEIFNKDMTVLRFESNKRYKGTYSIIGWDKRDWIVI